MVNQYIRHVWKGIEFVVCPRMSKYIASNFKDYLTKFKSHWFTKTEDDLPEVEEIEFFWNIKSLPEIAVITALKGLHKNPIRGTNLSFKRMIDTTRHGSVQNFNRSSEMSVEIPAHPKGRDADEKELVTIKFEDIPVVIEIPEGAYREGKDDRGKAWRRKMNCHYGYIKKTKGADGDEIDVFLNSKPNNSKKVFVINQFNKDGDFDEHKVMVGFATEEEAVNMYKSHYDKDWKVGPVSSLSIAKLKEWIDSGETQEKLACLHKLIKSGFLSSY